MQLTLTCHGLIMCWAPRLGELALVSCALQSEDTDSDMSDAEGRGSVSEDESSICPVARSKRLPGKVDSPDTQDSSEAVSHGGSKAGRGVLPL